MLDCFFLSKKSSSKNCFFFTQVNLKIKFVGNILRQKKAKTQEICKGVKVSASITTCGKNSHSGQGNFKPQQIATMVLTIVISDCDCCSGFMCSRAPVSSSTTFDKHKRYFKSTKLAFFLPGFQKPVNNLHLSFICYDFSEIQNMQNKKKNI